TLWMDPGHLSLLQGTSMPLTFIFRRLTFLRCALLLKNIFLKLITLWTLTIECFVRYW
uniref:Uncharacterized protein n=1 Tax=Oryctolagus cuniculus TaxID=9986 RepID=A0A5F9C256_RABIT